MKKMKKAFTLAEVLIALTIIGVVSALTIPTLVQKTNKQEYVSALQKTYSMLSQASNMIIAENGSPKAADGGWASSSENIYNMFKKYLSNAKECGSASGCLNNQSREYLKKLNGGYYMASYDDAGKGNKLILADGVQIFFGGAYQDCSHRDNGSENICGIIYADINGEKKPNTWGRDYFGFSLKENGLYPAGCDYDFCVNSAGYGCACKVIREGKMDY